MPTSETTTALSDRADRSRNRGPVVLPLRRRDLDLVVNLDLGRGVGVVEWEAEATWVAMVFLQVQAITPTPPPTSRISRTAAKVSFSHRVLCQAKRHILCPTLRPLRVDPSPTRL